MDVVLSLEIDFETELNSSGVGRCRCDLARICSQAALSVENHDVGCAKIRMVQRIEHFDAKLSAHVFPDAEVLEEREVEIGESGRRKSVAAQIS